MANQIILNEIQTDPNGHGYGSFIPVGNPTVEDIHKNPTQQAVNAAIATLFNAQTETVPVTAVSGNIIARIVTPGKLLSLTAEQRDAIESLRSYENVDPNDPDLEAFFITVFGNPSAQHTDLISKRTKLISPAERLGLKFVQPGHIAMARASGV